MHLPLFLSDSYPLSAHSLAHPLTRPPHPKHRSYERTVGYYLYLRGAHQTYSNIFKFRDDLGAHPPDYFVCVPLVLDTLHTKVGRMAGRGLGCVGWEGRV